MGFGNLIGDEQAEAGALQTFGGKEQTECLIACFLVHTDTVIGDAQDDAAGFPACSEGHTVDFPVFGQTASIHGVLEQVKEHGPKGGLVAFDTVLQLGRDGEGDARRSKII